jgi:biopolymer transport protein ExbB
MTGLIEDIRRWWSGGDLLMPVMLAVALVLYALLAERTLALARIRRAHRRGELEAVLDQGRGDPAWQRWAARLVAVQEAEPLARGTALRRALIACLPLSGLFGTVTGMVDTFAALAGPGAAEHAARRAGAGIGLALTATQYGMALAIPALVWDWILGRRIAAVIDHRTAVLAGAIGRPEGAPCAP